ncbi:MAG: septal ring lytic transglycosylase RlpA family protein [Deltaproteobacteria bacterium]|nr:septal ring lytic transglycosylase RlpA family protein [Candidatus Anaeroferrophillus wilburensis]MBN2889552.1 septal ring lytic transglycosylase RlpA family protein [Deltaproteobacteria bacterium]
MKWFWLLALLATGCWGCMAKHSRYDYSLPAKPRLLASQEGIASWYGSDFHGKSTASGELYDMHQLTAAHKELPLGSRVKVTNLENRKSVTVFINDRGPFIKGRIIDLSHAAAEALDMVDQGTALVRITLLEAPVAGQTRFSQTRYFGVQLGSFAERDNARQLYENLQPFTNSLFMQTADCGNNTCYRVRAGWFSNRDQAEDLADRLRARGYQAIVIIQDHDQ